MRQLALALVLALPSTACVAAAAGGAAGAVYLTSRGAQSTVEGPVDQVAARAQSVMKEMEIVEEAASTERGGDKRELKGKKGDLDVTVELERETETTTKVEGQRIVEKG